MSPTRLATYPSLLEQRLHRQGHLNSVRCWSHNRSFLCSRNDRIRLNSSFIVGEWKKKKTFFFQSGLLQMSTLANLRNRYWVLRHGKSIPNEKGLIISSLVCLSLRILIAFNGTPLALSVYRLECSSGLLVNLVLVAIYVKLVERYGISGSFVSFDFSYYPVVYWNLWWWGLFDDGFYYGRNLETGSAVHDQNK